MADFEQYTPITSIKDGVLTIQKNGSTVATFSANSANNVTANVTVPTVVNNVTSTSTTNALSAYQGKVLNTNITNHTGNTSNPHSVTASQVGLGNVENKSSETIRGEITSSNVTTALGYTPYNSTNPSGYITSSGSITGNAATATKAAQDGSGNVITNTYVKKEGDTMSGNLNIGTTSSSTSKTLYLTQANRNIGLQITASGLFRIRDYTDSSNEVNIFSANTDGALSFHSGVMGVSSSIVNIGQSDSTSDVAIEFRRGTTNPRLIRMGPLNGTGDFYIWDATNSKTILQSTQAGVTTFNGTATNATNDGSGNTISSTYVKKAGTSGLTSTLSWANSGNTTAIIGNASSGYGYIRLNAAAGTQNISFNGSTGAITAKTLSISGTKSRIVDTDDYGTRKLYCYEMANPVFGDIGEGQLDDTGTCYVYIDDILAEALYMDSPYQVFLQAYGEGNCYVAERNYSYFVVKGTPNMSFGWELKAIQKDYEYDRLEPSDEDEGNEEIENE